MTRAGGPTAVARHGCAPGGGRLLMLVVVLVPLGPIVDAFFLTAGRGIYATEVVLLAALATWLTRGILVHAAAHWPRPNLPVLLFCGYGAIGLLALVAGHADRFTSFPGYRMARVLLLAASTAYMVHTLAWEPGSRRRAIRLWTGATLIALGALGIYGIIEFLGTAPGDGSFEAASFYRSSVALAVHIAFFAPLALCVWLGASNRPWRLAGALSWWAAILCLPLTASRGGLGSVLATSVLALLVTARRTRGRAWRPIAVVLLVLMLAAALLATHPQWAGAAFARKYHASLAGDLFSSRGDAWREGWIAIRNHPLCGEGPEAEAPSVPLELARRHGLPAALLALAAMLTAAWSAARQAWRRDRDAAPRLEGGLHTASVGWGLALGLAGLLLAGLAESGLGARTTPLLAVTLAIAGMPAVGRRTHNCG